MEQTETRQALFETGQSVKHQNRHLREVYLVVGRGKNGNGYLLLGDEPVRTPYLQATDGSGFEHADGSAFRAGLVYENTDAAKAYRLFQQNAKPYRDEYDLISEADFYRAFGKIEPERQAAENSIDRAEKHHSEKIIDRLAGFHGWTKQDALTAVKSVDGVSEGGNLNPRGTETVYARFDGNGRYLALEKGWETVFDIDTRDARTETAAAVFNRFAQKSEYGIAFKPAEATEMLLTANSEDRIKQALTENGYGYVSTTARWEKTVGNFDITATFMQGETHLLTTDRLSRATEHTKFPSQETDAVMDYIGRQEKAALAHSQAEPSVGKEAALPPEERLQLAKHRYLMQGTTLTVSEKQMRAVLEHAMENLIHGLPPQVQMQARTNFYESQIQQQAQKYDMGSDLHNDYSPER